MLDRRGRREIGQHPAREGVLREAKLRVFAPAPEMIARPRLSEALVASRASLVLLAAPAGFGKTTLLAHWKEADPRPFAWLALDESDNDPAVLWAEILEAIRRVRPGFGSAAETALRSAHVNVLDALVPLILHELQTTGTELVVALDDCHVLESDDCHRSIAFFLDAKPANVQLVLAGRADPPIAIAKLRAAGDLVELRAPELSFTQEEEAAFLNESLGLRLGPEALGVLYDRTEGWPAGVYLASLSMRNAPDRSAFVSSFGGSNRHVVDYLTEVVLGSLERDQRSFLLETSVLDTLTAPLCDALTGRSDSAERLAELERENLFLVPLDDRRERYRYHQLFASLLRNELEQRDPDHVRELHRRASAWMEDAGDLHGAARHAVAAGEVVRAGELVLAQWLAHPHAPLGRPEPLLQWLEPLPANASEDDPRLALLEAWLFSMQRRREDAEAALTLAGQADASFALPDGTSVRDAAYFVRACFPWEDVGAFRSNTEAVPLASATAFWRPILLRSLGWARYLSGDFQAAKEPLEQAAVAALGVGQAPVFGAAKAVLARIALAEGDAEEAELLARKGLSALEAQEFADQPGAGAVHLALGAALFQQGRVPEASDLIVRGLAQHRLRGDALEIADALLVYAPVRRTLDTLPSARALIEEAGSLLAGCADPGILAEQLEDVARALTPAHRRIDGASELTERELEVLRYLAEGLPKRDIGRVLFLSYNTIHSHTKSIYQKLRVSSRQAAVERARELGALGD
jgi:LuxR family transcriptional regulator, maltose regulon positive regulatory protein